MENLHASEHIPVEIDIEMAKPVDEDLEQDSLSKLASSKVEASSLLQNSALEESLNLNDEILHPQKPQEDFKIHLGNNQSPLGQNDMPCLLSRGFIELFPDAQGDPTNPNRTKAVSLRPSIDHLSRLGYFDQDNKLIHSFCPIIYFFHSA